MTARVEARQVHGVLQGGAIQVGEDLLGHVDGHIHLGLLGVGAEVGRHHQPILGDQSLHQVGGGRLFREHVHRGQAHFTGLEGGQQHGLIQNAAPGHVQQDHPVLHEGQLVGADHAAGLVVQGRVHGDDVAGSAEFGEVHQLHTQILGPLGADVGVAAQHLALEGLEPQGHTATHLAQTDDAGGLPLELDPSEFGALPLPRLQAGVGGGHMPAGGEQQGQGMLGGTVGVAQRGIHYDDALGAGVVHVHVVDADPGPGHDFQIYGRIQQGPVHGGAAAGDDGVVLANAAQQGLLGKPQTDVEVDAGVRPKKG
jgi:hypothetical protein